MRTMIRATAIKSVPNPKADSKTNSIYVTLMGKSHYIIITRDLIFHKFIESFYCQV